MQFKLFSKVLKLYCAPRKMFSRAVRLILLFKEFFSYRKSILLFFRPEEQRSPYLAFEKRAACLSPVGYVPVVLMPREGSGAVGQDEGFCEVKQTAAVLAV